MADYTEPRAGYDVKELMWIKETTFKTNPSTGAWNHFGDPKRFTPTPDFNWRERTGLGRIIPKGFTIIKKVYNPVIEYDILKKDATNSYEWIESMAAILGTDVAAATIDFEKTVMSRCIGATLDFATADDEYWLIKGAKSKEFEIFGSADENVKVRETLEAVGAASITTTDFKETGATRETFPTTEPIVFGDCDFKVEGTSIKGDLQDFRLRITRDMERHGSDTTSTEYKKLIELAARIELEITMDFSSRTHLNQFLNATKFYAELEIPTGTGGRKLTLSASGNKQGVWRTLDIPHNELELIGLTLRGEFDTIAVTSL